MGLTTACDKENHRQRIGSALALHCCKAHAKINRKIENSTPCKMVTQDDFNLKLGTHDYVCNITHHAAFRSNRSREGFPPNRGNITLLWLFVVLYYFITRPGQTVGPIHNGCNDVFPLKDGPFVGQDDGWRHMGKYGPKTPQKGACSSTSSSPHSPSSPKTPPDFSTFKPASESEISKILFRCPNKQCDSDPIPTWLLKKCSALLVPTITNIVNLSLSSGNFHHTLKECHITCPQKTYLGQRWTL